MRKLTDHPTGQLPPFSMNVSLTCVVGFALHGEIHVALFGSLLHQLHHQLMGLAHHCCAVHTYELITGPQAAVLVCSAVLHYVADVDLKHRQRKKKKTFANWSQTNV